MDDADDTDRTHDADAADGTDSTEETDGVDGSNYTDDTDDANGASEAVPTWAALFARAATYGADESAVLETLARRRGRTDD
jgi:hypothetical protein